MQVMNQLKLMQANKLIVLRNGKNEEINAVDLVPGDVIKITAGEKVPADIRIL